MNILSMALEIVVVMEDFLTNFARIFPSGELGLRPAVDADSMTTQVEAILVRDKQKTSVCGGRRNGKLEENKWQTKDNENHLKRIEISWLILRQSRDGLNSRVGRGKMWHFTLYNSVTIY